MNKRNLAIFSFLLLFALGAGIFQYVTTFKAEIVDAYSATKPANGHAWSEMQCTSDMCIVGGKVGVGTDAPGQKLEVNGNILASGSNDVCNGSGKCLNSIFQNKVIAGTNPTCPVGQTLLMKGYNGTWYTADNAAITSWSKIICGVQVTSDGSALLVGENHTETGCTGAVPAGTVVSDGAGHNMCRFNAATCPAGWARYGNYSTTTATNTSSCLQPLSHWLDPYGPQYYGCDAATGYHAWANIAAEGCACCTAPNYSFCGTVHNEFAAITQIGCY